MKILRLVFENMQEEKVDIMCPMEEWIADWWFECNFVPENDTIILFAELDGESILDKMESNDFLAIAEYFNWHNLYNRFMYSIDDSNMKNSNTFKNWLIKNAE